jgi:serine/threonine protein kinase
MYTISEIIYRTGRTVLYRGTRDADGTPVILKVLGPQHRPQHLQQLRHEYEIGRMLDVPTAVRPLALDTYEGMSALVMRDSGCRPLDRLLGTPMEAGRFLPLAIRIADAVAEIHEKNILHRDLKPENILIHPATGEVQIADFGIASLLSGAPQAAGSARRIEGSLPYMSPEQTGRMNRTIDQRSDLYTLGVTFYQMLTGRLPFEAADPLEWVHCHIARSPAPPAALAPSVPAVLSEIVMKLLAKEADDRYQSARGLRHDLARCLDQWRSDGSIAPFPLGERDISDRLRIPQKLYGRDEEIAALLDAFQRVVGTGVPEMVLLAGYAGIGKSSLVHELQKPIVRARGIFVSGKFDQYKRDIPYFTIVQAFTEIVLEILTESETRIASWRQRLQAALGVNGQLIIDVIPQVELVIGRQAPVPALAPAEAQNRFRNVFRDFIGVFAQKEHPLALFLDDLQWADWASLALLQDLLTAPEKRHLLLVGAYRDNEVGASHPLMLTLHEARKLGAAASTITLGPLSKEHLGALIADALRCCAASMTSTRSRTTASRRRPIRSSRPRSGRWRTSGSAGSSSPRCRERRSRSGCSTSPTSSTAASPSSPTRRIGSRSAG